MRKVFCDHCGSEVLNLKNPDAKKPVKEIEVPDKQGKLICKIINCTSDDICQPCFIKYILKSFNQIPLFQEKPTNQQIMGACYVINHSFGLMNQEDSKELMLIASSWFDAWKKSFEDNKESISI